MDDSLKTEYIGCCMEYGPILSYDEWFKRQENLRQLYEKEHNRVYSRLERKPQELLSLLKWPYQR